MIELQVMQMRCLKVALVGPPAGAQGQAQPISILFDWGSPEEESDVFGVRMELRLERVGDPPAGMEVHVEVSARFRCLDGVPYKGDREETFRVAAASVLYSTLRGHVSSATALFPTGPLVLPVLDMARFAGDAAMRDKKKVRQIRTAMEAAKGTPGKRAKGAPKKKVTKKVSRKKVVKKATRKKAAKRK